MRNIHEIFDDFELAKSKKEKMDVIGKNLSKTLVTVLELTYHPNIEWLVHEMPENFKIKEVPAGMGYAQLSTELRKMYLFRKGEPAAHALSPRKQNEVLLQILESLEPREAEIIAGIFRKDQCVSGLDYKFVKEAFPQLLP
jgi:hypothetical protein